MRPMNSKTDAEAQLARKSDGKESKLSYSGNLLVENRNGLIVAAEVFVANGRAERDAALVMLEQIPGTKPVTVGGDKGFDTRDFVAECRHLGVTPHVAQNLARRGGSAIDGRTTQHSSYALSQKKRKRIEEQRWDCREVSHAHQVVGCAGEAEDPVHFAHSAMPHFAQQGDRLQPAETR